ncbi:MAG: Ig-like domain-containing protein, partial [Anaerolineae bacterium]
MMQRKSWINLVLTFFVLASLLLGACASPTPAEPTATAAGQPVPTSGGQAAPTSGGEAAPTTAAQAGPSATPTETPPPTLTPLPLPAPKLLSRSPAAGEQWRLDGPLTLTFDEPMDRASVEAAFTISPTIAGEFRWDDDRTVTFLPERELDRGRRYQVSLDIGARNAEGEALEEAIAFDLHTVGYLQVAEVMPALDGEDLDPDTVLTVVFDRPVVPLTAINRQDELPQPLTLMPPVQGEGEWLNTSVYLFRPDEGLLPATDYRARVAAGLTDTTGAVLAEDYTWSFSTLEPAVLTFWPPKSFQYMGPTDVISVTFNQPMDHVSVQEGFTLMLDDEIVDGRFRWSGGETAIAPETMVFVPDEPLPRGVKLTARVEQGGGARQGDKGLANATDWQFSTVEEPGVVSTSPKAGAKGVKPSGSVQITFASPMERKGFLDHLSVRPAVTNVYTYWSEYDTQVRVYFQREPATTYNVALDAATPDRYGATLDRAFRLRFATGDLPPYASLNSEGSLSTYNAYTETLTYVTYQNVSRLDLALYRLSPQAFVRLNSNGESWYYFRPDEEDLVRTWSRRVSPPRNEPQLQGFELRTGDGRDLPPGLYYLELSAPEARAAADDGYRPSRYMFVKSRLNLVLKQTLSEALVWATDLADGQPVGDVPIT